MKRYITLSLLLLAILLTACDAMATPATGGEAEESGSSTGRTPEQAESPDVILVYERGGGIAGFCDTLRVRAEQAEWEDCKGNSATIPLDEAMQQQLQTLVTTYASFEISSEDNPGGADNLIQTLNFYGTGDTEVTDEVQTTLQTLAMELLNQATSTQTE